MSGVLFQKIVEAGWKLDPLTVKDNPVPTIVVSMSGVHTDE